MITRERLIYLLDMFEDNVTEEANERGPDPDYRKWAAEKKNRTKARFIRTIDQFIAGKRTK